MISVIIPVHNNRSQILRSVNSVLNQDFKNFELLVIDDASIDKGIDLIKDISDPRIKIFKRSTAGSGGYAARNEGIRQSSFDWITFLDADDEWLPNHLNLIMELMHLDNRGVVSTGWYDSFPDGRHELNGFSEKFKEKGIVVLGFIQFLKFSADFKIPIHTNTVAIKRKLIQDIGGFPENRCIRGGDVTTWMNLLFLTDRLVCKPIPTAIYHREDSHVTVNTIPQIANNCIYQEVRKLLDKTQKLSRSKVRALKLFSNFHIRFGLIKKLKIGKLKLRDMSYFYAEVAYLHYFGFGSLALMPGFIQKLVFSISKKVLS
ncbi:glycosyltransferase family 2 protein [Algoriphagus hitonicola]|uniref:Glycosyl transferase family 2 n=1 Tax=Algoriphagus hitonicola TaxID=435880 RepID=A0A1I2X6Y9_9BACT|nr:glycosyltransferase family 2 protein [Algoriphagus hitonicola]SFH08456.1 Glycosyl transferase family 2 [Algoriphagus hitonicola]